MESVTWSTIRDTYGASNPVSISTFYSDSSNGLTIGDQWLPVTGQPFKFDGIVPLINQKFIDVNSFKIFMNSNGVSQSWKGVQSNGSNIIKLSSGIELGFVIEKSSKVYGNSFSNERYNLKCTTTGFSNLYVRSMSDQTISLTSNVTNDSAFSFRLFRYDSNYRIFSESNNTAGLFETFPYSGRWISYNANADKVVTDNWYANPKMNAISISGNVPTSSISVVPVATTHTLRYPSVPMNNFSTSTSNNALYGNGTYTSASTYFWSGREAWRTFDRDNTTIWQPATQYGSNAKLTISLPLPVKPQAYRIDPHPTTFRLRIPVKWTVEGSNNDGWTLMSTQSVPSQYYFTTSQNFMIGAPFNNQYYSSFRYSLDGSNALQGQTLAAVGEFSVYGNV